MTKYELFYQIASRCGYQFSALCHEENFQYRETGLLWDLYNIDCDYVIEKYLTYENLKNNLFMYFDLEAHNTAHLNSDTELKFDEVYENQVLINADKYYEMFLEIGE